MVHMWGDSWPHRLMVCSSVCLFISVEMLVKCVELSEHENQSYANV